MAVNIKFDLAGNPEPPTIILATRSGKKLGQLNVSAESIDLSDKLNDASEMTFTVYKYVDNKLANLWDSIVDFKLIYCKEWDLWFEIKVELDEETETVKTVFCTQLGQAELSQIMLYNIEINTEADIEREDYKISILWDENDPKASILDRLLEKAPHYSIVHVDDSIKNIQRSFSFDESSIYDAFQEIAEEIGCLFVFHSNSGEGGKIQRTFSVYDLQQKCVDCGYRGEFTDECPECGSKNIKYGYGEDTLIFVTADELAASNIQFTTDVDAIKNCFKLKAGDDLMTATVRNCNPNGTDYLWYFSDAVKEDMSKELVDKLNSYDDLYKDYYENNESVLDANLVDEYNVLVEKYEDYYNTKSTCLNCDYEAVFENVCPSCGSKSILAGRKLQYIPTTIKGYPSLMTAYYNTIDFALYLKSGLMPSIEMSDTSAEEQASLLTTSSLSPVAVNTKNAESISLATANSAVLSMAKIVVKSTYKVEIKTSTLSEDNIWEGSFIVTNYSDENDTAESQTIKIEVNNDTETFIKQKIEKSLSKEDTDDYSISGLFEKEYDDFCAELKKYALNPLNGFYNACDACLNILIDQGAGNKSENADLYEKLYEPYYNKSSAISAEIKIRENEIAVIDGVWDESNEENPKLITKGLQQYIEECKNEIQDRLDFEKYLGKELWLEFCCYRREDTYSNDNYISDGLNNNEIFEIALEFIKVAKDEIYKSAERQHSISTSLKNLLLIEKFKPLVRFFNVGNWIRIQVDDNIYKLRLLEYGISFGSLDDISVEFSDVLKIKSGITDVQNVLSQASSMATSYNSVQRQSKQGNEARSTIEHWYVSGLNSALINIKNNDNEEVTFDNNGILARSYDDITEKYSSKQLRITHNVIALTDDNWETVSLGIGEHDYNYYDSNGILTQGTGYGVSAKFLSAGYINGSQIIGGEIYSDNYKKNTVGTYINLTNGDFDFAGGKIVYNAEDNNVKLKGVTIQWTGDDGVNAPEVKMEDISGFEEYTDKLEEVETTANSAKNVADNAKTIGDNLVNGLGFKETEITGSYVISPVIAGGTLLIGDESGTYAQITTEGKLVCAGADISGDITATSLNLTGTVKGLSYNDLSDKPTIPESVTELGLDVSTIVYKSDITQVVKSDSNGISYVETSVPSSSGAITYSTYDADDYIVFGRSKGTNSSGNNYVCVSKEGLLTARNALIYGTIYATDGEFTGKVTATSGEIGGCSIEDGVLKIKSVNITDSLTIGQLPDTIAETSDIPTNDEIVTISRGAIDANFISTLNLEVGNEIKMGSNATISWNSVTDQPTILSENDIGDITTTIITKDYIESLNIIAENISGTTLTGKTISGGSITIGDSFSVSNSGILSCSGATINGVLSAGVGSSIGGFAVDSNSIYKGSWDSNAPNVFISTGTTGTYTIGGATKKDWVFGAGGTFGVTGSGSLYCTNGEIGGWLINPSSLSGYSNTNYVQITPDSCYYANSVDSQRYTSTTWENIIGAGQYYSNESSDRNIKNSISDIDDYDVMFDNLEPCRYKYNYGTSDRYHTGFIAQDVVSAIESAGLTTQDFAGVIHLEEPDENGCEWMLRRDEFVALNTWQIQKLKQRVAAIEAKIKSLQ